MNSKEAVSQKPVGVSDDMVNYWKQKGFSLHYIPNLDMINSDEFAISQKNSKLLEKTKPLNKSHSCLGRWILVETTCIKRVRIPWINSADTHFLTYFGIRLKKFLQKHTKTHTNDVLDRALSKNGQYSRFCMDITEVKSVLSEVRSLLNLPSTTQVRLPHYVEYCYLCKNYYPEWTKSKTWEWLEDVKEDGQHLATGYGTWNIIGYDPSDFWSTILGFRVIVEL